MGPLISCLYSAASRAGLCLHNLDYVYHIHLRCRTESGLGLTGKLGSSLAREGHPRGASPSPQPQGLELRLGGSSSSLRGALIPSMLLPCNNPPTIDAPLCSRVLSTPLPHSPAPQGSSSAPSPALGAGEREVTIHPRNPGGTRPQRGVISSDSQRGWK